MKVREPLKAKGDPLALNLEVSLEELYTGATRVEDAVLTVEIPAGLANGTVITFAGVGNQFIAGTQQGDVKLTIVTLPHTHFERRGVDLVYTHKLDLCSSLVGHTVQVKLLDNHTIAIPVPEISTSKDEKRLVGRGMPRGTKGPGFGDVIVCFEIVFPKELTT